MKVAAIILSQPFRRYLGASFVISADAGFKRALERGIRTDLLVGDMDSLGYVPQDIKRVQVPVEKDFSDGELAVRQAVLLNVDRIDIYGAVGGREDHFLYNTHLLHIASDLGVSAVIRGDDFDLFYLDESLFIDTTAGDVLSIVPFGETSHIIQAKGLRYPASDVTLTKGDTLGLSNECTGENVYLRAEKGKSALVFHYFDREVSH